MSKFMTGIDGIDICTLMAGLEGIHECNIELTVRAGTLGDNGTLDTTALAWVPALPPESTRTIAEVKGTWPDKKHPSLDAFLFALLYELDRAIGRAYAQAGLPK